MYGEVGLSKARSDKVGQGQTMYGEVKQSKARSDKVRRGKEQESSVEVRQCIARSEWSDEVKRGQTWYVSKEQESADEIS